MTNVLTAEIWKVIEDRFGRPCELNDNRQIVARDDGTRLGYIAEGEHDGWLVDVTGDSDVLVQWLPFSWRKDEKKGAVGAFEIWHTGQSMYEIRNAAGWCVARAVSLNAAYKKAERWNGGISR